MSGNIKKKCLILVNFEAFQTVGYIKLLSRFVFSFNRFFTFVHLPFCRIHQIVPVQKQATAVLYFQYSVIRPFTFSLPTSASSRTSIPLNGPLCRHIHLAAYRVENTYKAYRHLANGNVSLQEKKTLNSLNCPSTFQTELTSWKTSLFINGLMTVNTLSKYEGLFKTCICLMRTG